MPGKHYEPEHARFLVAQMRAGRSPADIRRNYRHWQVRRARICVLPSRTTLWRLRRQGCLSQRRTARHRIGHSLEARHKKLIDDTLGRFPTTRTAELAKLLRRNENGLTSRTDFAHSTIDNYIRDEMDQTNKKVTYYHARLNLLESARSRRALKRYPPQCYCVVDGSAIRRKDFQRTTGWGPRIFGRTISCGDHGGLRTLMGVMTIRGFDMRASKVIVRTPPVLTLALTSAHCCRCCV